MKRLVFPFYKTYEAFKLRDRWWHRAALVLLIVGYVVSALTLFASTQNDIAGSRRYCVSYEMAAKPGLSFNDAYAECTNRYFGFYQVLGMSFLYTVPVWYLAQLVYRVLIYIALGSVNRRAAVLTAKAGG